MKLLLTGGCGFIGSNLVHFLLAEGAARLRSAGFDGLVNLDKLTYAGVRENVADHEGGPGYTFVQGDFGNAELVAHLLAAHDIGGIVHLAAESHVDRSIDSAEVFFATNVLGTTRLLETARRWWRALPAARAAAFRFHHVSTDEVFGTLGPADPPFRETTPLAPNNPYAASKAGADCAVRAYGRTHGLPVVTTNCSNNYGPYHFPEKLIPLCLLNALEGRPLPIYGDGQQVRDWLYVGDHCEAIWTVFTRGRPGETYCVGGHNEIANLDLVRQLCRRLDDVAPADRPRPFERLITFVADRPGHDRRYAIDSGKIEAELGWRPRETFATGLIRTVDWYLANLSWCDAITQRRYARERLGRA